jgi:hypothetical protein
MFTVNSIDKFVKNWGSKNAMVPINTQDIVELESKLSISLPESYKYLITTYGLVHSPNVLTKICDLNSDVSAVQDFLSLDDVFTLSNLYEMSGMPKGHILFASDCQGSMFCFKHDDCLNQESDVPVWFYDRENFCVKQVSSSFSDWLEGFNEL